MSENAALNLYQKLAKIRAISDVAQKSKRGFNYSYTDITEILANVTAGMKKYGVSLVPSIVPESSQVEQNVAVNTKVDKTGKTYEQKVTEMLYKSDMVFRWVNDDNPSEVIDVPWFVTGSQSDPSQAFGSALTYGTRYFLTSYFQIAQPESDVDAYRSRQKAAEESEERAIAEQIIQDFDGTVRRYLSNHPDQGEDVKKFIGRYVKGGNYQRIKEPSLASKLAADFAAHYGKGEKKHGVS